MLKSFEIGKFYSYEIEKYNRAHRVTYPVLFALHIMAEGNSIFTEKPNQLVAEYYTSEGAQGVCFVNRSIEAQLDAGYINLTEITEKEFKQYLNTERAI